MSKHDSIGIVPCQLLVTQCPADEMSFSQIVSKGSYHCLISPHFLKTEVTVLASEL